MGVSLPHVEHPTGRVVVVTGSTGFIGQRVVKRLLEQGWLVRGLRRNGSVAALEQAGRLDTVWADVRDLDSLRRAIAGASVVVHLAAAMRDEPESYDVNVGGARNLVDACRVTGCTRLINISTQSAKIPRRGLYGSTKAQADEIFHDSGLDVTTLRLSVVYGEERRGVFGALLGAIRKFPIVPVLGNGQWRAAPVYVEDVATAIVACIVHDRTMGKQYDVGGPDLVTLDHLLNAVAAAVGLRRRIVHVPFPIALGLARALAAVLPRPPITVSNVLGSNQSSDIDIGPARQDFGFAPIGLERGLALVLSAPSRADHSPLAGEATLFAKYLLKVEPSKEVINRYIAAHDALPELGADSRELRFLRRHAWALPFLDAAIGFWCRDSVVRRKMLVMAAILEASPGSAEFLLSAPSSPLRLLRDCAWQATRASVKLVIGTPLLALARHRR